MFVGTNDKRNPNRRIDIQTLYQKDLNLACIPQHAFHVILFKNGLLSISFNRYENTIIAPAVLCLNEQKMFKIIPENVSTVNVVSFLPNFLNVNMRLDTLRNSNYSALCEQHSYFQLSPFLTDNPHKIGFSISIDTYQKLEYSIENIQQNLSNQADWYWSCRARSYFIDVINILERMYHNFNINADTVTEYTAVSYNEFTQIVSYINNHLDSKITLQFLYDRFFINKNKIENLFQKYYKTTLAGYLSQRRYEEACYYLRFTELDGDHIASRIDFSCSQNFCRFFVKMSGTTPQAFRKEALKQRKCQQ